MGLFGAKTPGVKLTDFYTAEELQTIRARIDPKLAAGQYAAMAQLLAKGMSDLIKRADRETSYAKQGKFMKIAASFIQFEPDLAPILQNGINKYQMGFR